MVFNIKKNLDVLIISLCIIAISAVSHILIHQGLDWYKIALKLPSVMPSEELLTLVWTVIYILSAASIILLERAYKHNKYYKFIINLFILMGLLHILWNYIFFVHHVIGGALLVNTVMEFCLLTIIFMAYPDAHLVALLNVPQALWLIYAWYLTYQVFILN